MAVERSTSAEPTPTFTQASSPEEVARRRQVVDELLALRAAIGPVKMTLAEALGHRFEEENG